jgi:type IV secretion system protein VirD4
VLGLLAVGAALAAVFWTASELAGWIEWGHRPRLGWAGIAPALRAWPGHLSDPLRAWPASPAVPAGPRRLLGDTVFYLCGLILISAAASAARWFRRPTTIGARWARPADLRPLRTRRTTGRGRHPKPGRLALGRTERGRLLATEARHSVLVIGPTQSGKTTGLAIPAILEWEGPVVATSVKDDLAAHTIGWRAGRGPCAFFDPTGATLIPRPEARARWSPVSACDTWSAAQKMAAWLVDSTPGRRGMADAAFWYATAAKQLAPLLLAAERGGYPVAEVARWTDSQEFEEPQRVLEVCGEERAAEALAACAGREERIRSSVATTLETVLAPFEDPVVAAATAATDLAVPDLLARQGTLYLCGPTHEQHRVQGLFAALVSTVVDVAVASAPLDPPLLLVLDEAANIAPVRDLDALASTAAGLGVQLVTVCQDLAQLAARYDGERARTIANNHRAKLLLSGVSDIATLDLVSGLAGEQAVREETTTDDLRTGGRTRSVATTLRRLAPADELRRVEPGRAVLVYGHLPPVRLRLRPWYLDRRLRKRAGAGGPVGAGPANRG